MCLNGARIGLGHCRADLSLIHKARLPTQLGGKLCAEALSISVGPPVVPPAAIFLATTRLSPIGISAFAWCSSASPDARAYNGPVANILQTKGQFEYSL